MAGINFFMTRAPHEMCIRDRCHGFHGGFQIGADKVDGEGDAFFQQAAYAQPPAGAVPAEFPVMEDVYKRQ